MKEMEELKNQDYNLDVIHEIYQEIKQELIQKGYRDEMNWCNNIPSLQKIDKNYFFREYSWVVISSGMKNQVAEKIYKNFMSNGIYDFNAIRHPYKNKAIQEVYNKLEFYFDRLLNSENKLEFLKSLPHIGDITKYHLARNLGLDYAKPDRHLVRLSEFFGYEDVQIFCNEISKLSQDKIGLIDLILWRFANLTPNYIKVIKEKIKLRIEEIN